jgi:hypothetical protein
MPGRLVSKKTYVQEYHKLTEKTGIAFVPDAAWKDAVFRRGDPAGDHGVRILVWALRAHRPT